MVVPLVPVLATKPPQKMGLYVVVRTVFPPLLIAPVAATVLVSDMLPLTETWEAVRVFVVILPVFAKLPLLSTVQILCSAKLRTSRGVSLVEGLVIVRVLAVAAPAWFMDALSVPPL